MSCPECALRAKDGFSIYTVRDDAFGLRGWSKDRAMDIIRKREAKPQAIPDWVLDRFLNVNDFTEEHLAHVDIQYPGIVAQFLGRFMLIDGTHRAVRSKREGKQYYAYVLDLAESELCRLHGAIYPDDEEPKLLTETLPGMTAEQLAGEIKLMLNNNPHSAFTFQMDSTGPLDDVLALLTEDELTRVKFAETA
jgi:hypothetical protein